jgi:manganese transport protein
MVALPSPEKGWSSNPGLPSLPEVFSSVHVPRDGGFWRKLFAFMGPGYLVAVGYMDPGNWATDLAGGSAFGYSLLSVIVFSNLVAMLLQALSAKLGIVAERDLAQACRDSYSRPVNVMLWLACELAIAACDLAEVIGTAIALNLLFRLPLVAGIGLTTLDVFLVLLLQKRGFRYLEAFVIALLAIIAGCFAVQLLLARPALGDVFTSFMPRPEIFTNPKELFIAIGILGATVMPHNLYLHSSIVQTRAYDRTPEGKRQAIRLSTIDSTVALFLALFINGAILVLAGAVFHNTGHAGVAEIQDAHRLMAPLLGAGFASVLFALALFASGQNSTVTATLAGQIIMEGFLHFTMAPWLRRLVTRMLAVIPAAIVAALWGAHGTAKLLVLSQVLLSLQLPFAVIPLVQFTSSKAKMGEFANRPWLVALAWSAAALIVILNLKLLVDCLMS